MFYSPKFRLIPRVTYINIVVRAEVTLSRDQFLFTQILIMIPIL